MKALLFTLIISSTTFAQASQLQITNFNFNYRAPIGEGVAESFSYQKAQSQKVQVEKVGDDFVIQLEGVENEELTFQNPPALIKDANNISLSAFNLRFQDKATLSIAAGSFKSPDKTLDMKNLSLNCDRISSHDEVMDQLIAGCIQKMSLKTNNFSTSGEGFEQAFMKAFDESHDELKSSIGIKNVDLKISGGNLDLSAEIKAQISGKAKASGTVKYDASGKLLTVKLSSVKFGILDVTSTVFEELKKQENANLKVSKPYIHITIK